MLNHHEQYWIYVKNYVCITPGNNVLLSILFSLNAQVKLFILNQTRIVGYVLCSRTHDLWVSPGPHGTFDTIWCLSNVGSHTTWLSMAQLSSPTGSKVAFGCIIIAVTFDIISVSKWNTIINSVLSFILFLFHRTPLQRSKFRSYIKKPNHAVYFSCLISIVCAESLSTKILKWFHMVLQWINMVEKRKI